MLINSSKPYIPLHKMGTKILCAVNVFDTQKNKKTSVLSHSIARAHKASECRKLRSEPRFTPDPFFLYYDTPIGSSLSCHTECLRLRAIYLTFLGLVSFGDLPPGLQATTYTQGEKQRPLQTLSVFCGNPNPVRFGYSQLEPFPCCERSVGCRITPANATPRDKCLTAYFLKSMTGHPPPQVF